MERNVLLIVVIDAEQRARFKWALEGTHHHLVFALDADEGLERFTEAKPDLVLTADRLPSVRGTRLLSRLRALPEGAEVPVVVFGTAPKVVPHSDGRLSYPFERRMLLGTIAPLLAYGRPEFKGGPPGADARTLVGYPNPFVGTEVERRPGSPLRLVDPEPVAPRRTDTAPSPTETTAPSPNEVTTPAFVAGPAAERADGVSSDTPLLPEPPLPSEVSRLPEPPLPSEVSRLPEPPLPSDTPLLPEPPLPSSLAPRPETPLSLPDAGLSTGGAATPASGSIEASDPGFEAESMLETPDDAARRPLDESQLGQRFIQRIGVLHEALVNADHYELLGVARADDADRIHAAWFELALELHPDRFFLLRSGELKERIYRIYRRLAEAHGVLSDPELRSTYDRQRAEENPPPKAAARESARLEIVVEDAAAAIFAERAEAALAREAIDDARFNLYAILACEPDNDSAKRALDVVEAHWASTI